jgi:hypothetical protein
LVTATLGRAIVKERFKPKKLNGIADSTSSPSLVEPLRGFVLPGQHTPVHKGRIRYKKIKNQPPSNLDRF